MSCKFNFKCVVTFMKIKNVLQQHSLHKKRNEVCFRARSNSASLSFIGLVNEHRTVKEGRIASTINRWLLDRIMGFLT